MSDIKKEMTCQINKIKEAQESINSMLSMYGSDLSTPFASGYPFEKSFDEYDISNWLHQFGVAYYKEATVKYIKEFTSGIYTTCKSRYMNTGGNRMILYHSVFDRINNKLFYIRVDDESCALYDKDVFAADYDDESEVAGRITLNSFRQYEPSDLGHFGHYLHKMYIEYCKLADIDKGDAPGVLAAWITPPTEPIGCDTENTLAAKRLRRKLDALVDFDDDESIEALFNMTFHVRLSNGTRQEFIMDATTCNALRDMCTDIINHG